MRYKIVTIYNASGDPISQVTLEPEDVPLETNLMYKLYGTPGEVAKINLCYTPRLERPWGDGKAVFVGWDVDCNLTTIRDMWGAWIRGVDAADLLINPQDGAEYLVRYKEPTPFLSARNFAAPPTAVTPIKLLSLTAHDMTYPFYVWR